MNAGYQFCAEATYFPAEGYSRSLFHTTEHFNLKAGEVKSFFIIHPKREACCGEVHFHANGTKAISRRYAPFGSFLFKENLEPEVLNDFTEYCEEELRNAGFREIILIHAPNRYYARQYGILHPLLFQKGFSIIKAEVSALLNTAENFAASLHEWEQRKLRQAREAGLQVNYLSLEKLRLVYDFIAGCRSGKGYQLSMNDEEIQQLAVQFAEAVHLFAVYDGNRMVAAAFCVAVNEEILYAFYYDHHADYDHVSPVVLLMEFIHRWCAEKNFRYIDLGTSSSEDSINFPLLSFKLHLGAVPSAKYTFQKVLK